ncbi:hypothetical protein ACQ4M4_08515 [Leptolyngbya sp. AN02str]|uniref:hypothetical protein n=1 Tax=Leptolyngbya sp. AN02str TaxID=3423363 RepID=UPI003D32089B
MNPDDIFQTIQKGFHVTLGATTEVIESIQNAERREQTLTKLKSNPNQLADELAAKGQETEREARTFVDSLFQQPSSSTSGNYGPGTTPNVGMPTTNPETEAELKELVVQIAAMRAELEKLRNPNP